jgi:hypothetical protein
MYHIRDLVISQNPSHQCLIGNITLDELDLRSTETIRDVVGAPRVGEQIQDDNAFERV